MYRWAYPYAGYATPTRYPRNPYAIQISAAGKAPREFFREHARAATRASNHPHRAKPSGEATGRATRQSAVDTAGAATDSDTTRARTTARQLTRLSTHDPSMHMDILATAQSAEHGPTVTVDFQPTRLWEGPESAERNGVEI